MMNDLIITCPATYPEGYKAVAIGEAPGADEERDHEGFVGPAGKVFQKASRIARVEWSSLGKSNVAKRRPFHDSNDFERAFYEIREEAIYTPKGNLSKKTKKVLSKTQELLAYESLLRSELQLHSPNLLIAAGSHALEAITGLKGITNYRGSVVSSTFEKRDGSGPFKVLAVEHPSYILRGNTLDFFVLVKDLEKAKREMEFPDIRREPYEEIIRPTKDQIFQSLDFIRVSNSIWTLDVETRAGTLACFGIGYRDYCGRLTGICIPIHTTSGPYWSPQDEMEIWSALNETTRGNPFLCNQNIEYDLYYLLRHHVEPSGVWMCTMLAHSILSPELPNRLAFLLSWYLDDVVYYKGEGKDTDDRDARGTTDEELWKYNIKDDVQTLRLVEAIDRKLKQRGLWEMYHGKPKAVPTLAGL